MRSTNSLLIGAIEAYRIGFQLEQALFEKFPPLFLWGGGVAIKQQLEDEITWDRSGITKDTAFIFSIRRPYTFKYSKHQIQAEAPLTVKDLIKQRWRWASGTYHDIRYLRIGLRKILVYFRIAQWSLWPLYAFAVPLFLALPLWVPILITFQSMVWSFAGTRIMKLPWHRTAIAVLITPIASFFHSIGATLALVKLQKKFLRTPKQNSETAPSGMLTSRHPQQAL
jgi:cellulose synthase/poly-beta-1,6-N-acetylglucosamine synthase-like glycosyltransferase